MARQVDWANQPANTAPEPNEREDRVFRERDIPELLSGAAEFSRKYEAPFITIVEFIDDNGQRDYIPITHPDYKGKLADTPKRAAQLLAAVRKVTERDNAWQSDSLRERQDIAKSMVVRK